MDLDYIFDLIRPDKKKSGGVRYGDRAEPSGPSLQIQLFERLLFD